MVSQQLGKSQRVMSTICNFMESHPEPNFEGYLDSIFHRILLILCEGRLRYAEVMEAVVLDLGLEGFKKGDLITVWQKLVEVVCVDIDEAVIANFLGFNDLRVE